MPGVSTAVVGTLFLEDTHYLIAPEGISGAHSQMCSEPGVFLEGMNQTKDRRPERSQDHAVLLVFPGAVRK